MRICVILFFGLLIGNSSGQSTLSSVTKCLTDLSIPADCCWCTAVALPDPTLQIGQIQAASGLVKLINVAELKEILTAADIADAKVVIFSIVGETRAGKSTLLNIIYRYLACHQRKKSRKDIGLHEWLYEREEWQGMRQVFATSSQSRAQTKNIWITKQPFILTMGKLRSKVAVFLIDTQGLFDTDSNSTVDSQLFYLSSLLSSTLVVNKMRRLDGSLTKQVAAYTLQMTSAFKSTSLVSSGKSKFLQDLVFLIRDAQFLEPYGWESGKTLLQAAFPPDGDDLLREMEAAFQQISSFLMPNIALNTTNLKILPSRLTSDFGPQVQKFLDKLFSPNSIRAKTFYGRSISAREYAEHVQMVESLMKNGTFPSVQDVHQALMTQAVQRVSEEACAKYRYNMDGSLLLSMELLSEETFERYHSAFLEQAKEHLRSNYLLAASHHYTADSIEIVSHCTQTARKDYLVKLLLQRDAAQLKKRKALAEEASRRAELELEKARHTINQQSTVLGQENSWADSITKPIKLVVFGIIGFASLCVLYAAVTCLGKRCFKD